MRKGLKMLLSVGVMASMLQVVACGDKEDAPAADKTKTTAPAAKEAKSNAAPSSAEDVGDVLATVNKAAVGSKSFEQAASRKSPSTGDSLSIEDKKEVLERLIEEELLYQEALKRGLDRDPKVKKVMVNALLREDVYGSIRNADFSNEELKAYYESHKEEFTVPEKVQIYRILIKVNDKRPEAEAKSKAEGVYKKLKKDPSKFKDLASQESEDPYRRRGGDVGFVPKKGKPGLDEEVVTKAFSMRVETLSKPFLTKDGYNVIYIPSKREAVERTFEQMKGAVLRKVKNEKLSTLHKDYTSKLRAAAEVTVDDTKLSAIEIKPSARPRMGLPMEGGGEGGMDKLKGLTPGKKSGPKGRKLKKKMKKGDGGN
jgi:parvulin-like peptidyl-prolyl isomerase